MQQLQSLKFVCKVKFTSVYQCASVLKITIFMIFGGFGFYIASLRGISLIMLKIVALIATDKISYALL